MEGGKGGEGRREGGREDVHTSSSPAEIVSSSRVPEAKLYSALATSVCLSHRLGQPLSYDIIK